ncbi:MAG: helix-turn-helix domain-containing protein [Dehalococcoidia bacterium]
MAALQGALTRWRLDLHQVQERMYRAPTPRERERWHELWLLARGWSAAEVAEALARDPHAIGEWEAHFCRSGPTALAFVHSGDSPRPDGGATGRTAGGGASAPSRSGDCAG